MPYQYVMPDEAFEIRTQSNQNIPVYHCYKGSSYPDALTFWYTIDGCEDQDNEFDIRSLPNFPGGQNMSVDSHANTLQYALDNGLVTFDGLKLRIRNTPQTNGDQ